MAIEIQAPNDFSQYLTSEYTTIFAGGSIEGDTAKPWQKRLVHLFKDCDNVVIVNPRRNVWHSSWKCVASNKKFRAQVEWELLGLELCDTAIMYFDPATKSPISLLEFGRFGKREWQHDYLPPMHVICPPGFWRKGNVDIVCERYDIPTYSSLTAASKEIKRLIQCGKR